MNRNYKVIWNASLNCFMAVAEYAKSRGKSSSTVVSSSASNTSATGGMRLLRLSALSAGLVAAGLSMPAMAGYEAGDGSTNVKCSTTSTGSGTTKSTGIAIGNTSTSEIACAPTIHSIAIGAQASTAGIDTAANDTNNQSIAIGNKSRASGDQAIALGANVIASGNSSIAIGGDDVNKVIDEAGGIYTTITGSTLVKNVYKGTESFGAGSTAVGVQAAAKGAFSTALGMTSLAEGAASVALGVNSKATEKGALAIGAVSNASGVGSVALGINSKSSGLNSIAIGSGSTSTTGANSLGENATSIGSQSSAAANATAIGAGAKATIAGGVAIGTGSVANIVAGIKGFDPSTSGATTQTSNVWNSTRAAVALGDGNTITRQLTGLAAGTNDSDAVNVAQLKTVTDQTFKVAASTGGVKAVKTSDTVKFVDGKNIKVIRTDNSTGTGSDITIATVDALDVTSVKAGNNVFNSTGLTIEGGPSITTTGINAGNKKVIGVLGGSIATGSTEAVNGGQLFGSAESIKNVIGGNAVNTGGVITTSNIGGTDADTIDGAITKVNNAAKAAKTVVTQGENILVNETIDSVTGVSTYEVKTKRDLALDSVKAGNNVFNSTGLTIEGGPSITTTGINAGNKKVIGVLGGSIATGSTEAVNGGQLFGSAESIKNVIGGNAVNTGGVITTSNIGGTDADTIDGAITKVNNAAKAAKTVVTQGENILVNETIDSVTGVSTYEVKTKRDLALDSVKAGNNVFNSTGLTIEGGPSITTTGINAGNKKVIGVLGGSIATGSTEAVNGGQLFGSAESIKNVIGGNAVNTGGVITTSNIGGTDADTIDGAITKVNNAAKAAKTVVTQGENILVNETIDSVTGVSTYEVKTKRDLALDSVKAGNNVFNSTGLTIEGGPSITTTGINAGNKKVIGVLGGSIATGSTEAVNGGQLFGSAESIKNVIGGNAVNTGGVITTSNIGGTDADTIDGAITKVNNAAKAAKTVVTQGENILVNETIDSVTGVSTYEVKTKRDLALDSVKAGNNVFNSTGLTIEGGPSITTTGINAGNKKVIGVLGGSIATGSTEAVNGGQLFGSAESIKNVIGGNAVNTGGVITTSNIGGTDADTIDGAITKVNNAAKAAKTVVTQGENILVNETIDSVTGVSTYEVKTKRDLALDSVKAGNNVFNSTGLTIEGGPSITTTGINAGNKKVIGVLGGSIATGSTEAVNGGQLFGSAESIKNVIGGNAVNTGGVITTSNIGGTDADTIDGAITKVNNAAKAAKTVVTQGENILVNETIDSVTGVSTYEVKTKRDLALDSVKAGNNVFNSTGLTIEGGPSITTTGINAGNKKVIGVLGGSIATGSTEAVNGGQLFGSAESIKNVIGGNAVNTGGVITTSNIGGTDADTIDGAITKVNNAAKAAKTVVTQGENILVNETIDSVTGVSTYEVKTKRDLALDSVKAGNNVFNSTGLTIEGGPSITTTGINAGNKKVIGVLGGSIATGSTEAVNGGQLFGSAESIKNVIGGNAVNTGGVITTSNIGGTDADTIDGAITKVNNAAKAAKTVVTQGENILVNETIDSVTGVSTYEVKTSKTLSGLTSAEYIDALDPTKVTNVTAAGSNVTDGANTSNYGANGFTATDAAGNGIMVNKGGIIFINGAGVAPGPSISIGGINAGKQKITGLLDGTEADDAATVGQLGTIAGNITAGGVQYDKNVDGTINKGSITLGGAAGTIITNVKGGAINTTSTDAVNGGQLHNLGSGIAGIIGGDAKYDADGNLTANNIGSTGKGTVDEAIKSINQGNADNAGNIQANTNDIKANADRLDAGLSFGADNGIDINKPIGDGTVFKFEGSNNITTTTTANGIKFDLNGNISVDSVTTGNTNVNNNGVTIKDGPSMTIDGIYAGNKTITGVADGIKINDAVNLGQLNALDQKISNSVNELGYKVSEVEDGANAGVSAAMAMSSLPQAYIPGKSMIGGGIATYNGQSAVAVGISKVSDNGRWVIKANGTADTQGNAGGAIGAGFHF